MRSSSINSSRRFESQRMNYITQFMCQQQVIDITAGDISTLTSSVTL
jgi:hypothetical protein